MGFREPHVVINGVTLTEAQSATVRVALCGFVTDLESPEFFASLGEIGPLYRKRLAEVLDVVIGKQPPAGAGREEG